MQGGAVVVDTEYTTWRGALERGWSGPGEHREIVQIAAVRLDAGFAETASLDVLVKPLLNPVLSPFFMDLTHIGQAEVDAEGVDFPEAMARLLEFTGGGSLPVVCMNSDGSVFRENCRIHGVDFPFPQDWHRLGPLVDPLLRARGIDPRGMSSGDLHRLTPEPLQGHTHNALHDVRSMACWMRHEWRTGNLHGFEGMPTDVPARDPRRTGP